MTFVVSSERNKWFLSSVLFFGLGVAAFFSLSGRVSVAQVVPAVILLLCGGWIARRWTLVAFVLQLAFCFFTGLAVSALHTENGPQNLLTRTLYMTEVEGTVIKIEPRGSRLLATIVPTRIDGLDRASFDWNVRISFLGDADLAVGDRVTARARLFPLRAPSVPGDPDFSRALYFDGIGASGFAFGRQFSVDKSSEEYAFINGLWQTIEAVRQNVSGRIDAALDWPESGIAKALIIGERGDVGEDIAEDLRRSGLAHLLAISGLHMGLLCGTVFFLVRFGLACIPAVALQYPIKKWAAVAAMAAGLIYLGLSGATVPTQRAFIMLFVVWIAVLIDRRAISLRLVGVAAVLVLLVRPDVVLGASFQLSFAAVGILVAFYDGPGRRWLEGNGQRSWPERILIYLMGLMITGMLVTAVTAPIIGYHFGRISMLGIVANLVAIPVMAFWVMPLIVLALALMPVGLEWVALWGMKPGLGILLETADLLGRQEWGLWYVSAFDGVAVGCAVFALAWFMIWRISAVSMLSVPVLLVGIWLQAAFVPSDILISGDRESWAVFDRDARILHLPKMIGDFQEAVWQSRFGLRPEESDAHTRYCAEYPCFLPDAGPGKRSILIADRVGNPFYACRMADIVVDLQNDLPRNACTRADMTIDDDVLWWQGGVALATKGNDMMHVATVKQRSGGWPWIVIGNRIAK